MKKNDFIVIHRLFLWMSRVFFQRKFKLIALIVLVFQLSVSAQLTNKTLSLSVENTSIKQILKQIESKSDYSFAYNSNLIDVNDKVDFKVSNKTITEALSQLFKNKAIAYKINGKIIALTKAEKKAEAGPVKISGVVLDNFGETLPGTNVVVKGTTVGTITDIDGNFELTLDEATSKTLLFSSMGFATQEVFVGNQREFNITMAEDAVGLDEVVVTALGIKKEKKALGYAVTEVNSEEIQKAASLNPVDGLQGQVAGVNIKNTDGGLFGGTKIEIRGVSTLGGNNQPIFVVDGVILDNGTSGNDEWGADPGDWGNELKNLNPDDFESVSVLKGSAATALYGSRGINGAVIITTKGSKVAKGFGVSVSQSLSLRHVYDMPDFQYEFGPGTVPAYVSYGSDKFNYNTFKTDKNGNKTLVGASGLGYGPKFDGSDIIGYDGKTTKYQGYENNYEDFYRVGVSTNTNVSVQGGSDKTKFFLSESFTKQEGTTRNESMSRNSLMLKASHQISDDINLSGSITYAMSSPKNGARGTGFIKNSYDTEYYMDKYKGTHGGLASSDYGDEYGNVPHKGYWFSINENTSEREEQSVRPIVKLNYNITNWASITLEGNMNMYSYKHEVKNLGSGYQNEGGYYSLEHYRKAQQTGKMLFNFNKQFGEFGNNLMIGGEIFKTEDDRTKVETDGGLIVPGEFFLDNSKKTRKSSGSVGSKKQLNSFYFVYDVDWKNQLFLSVTGRNDWSSALVYSNGTGNNSYFYPSVSTSWLFSDTFKMPKWFDYGKLRASWAQVGKDTDAYFINKGYKIKKIEVSSGEFAYVNEVDRRLVDPDLKPERKTSIEFGVDLRFLQNRVGLDVTWYKENTKDQIVEIGAPGESGISGQIVNAGEIQNDGWEIALNTVPVKTKDFRWDLDFTYTKNNNEVISLHESLGEYKNLVGGATYGDYRIGSVAYVGGEYATLMSDSKPKVNDKGQKILSWDDGSKGASYQRSKKVEKIGTTLPDFLASMRSTLEYKNFVLTFAFDARFGGYMASYTSKYGTAYGYTEASLKGREGHGGIEWNSSNGNTYKDGVILDGVFADGTKVSQADGSKVDVGGMTYQEAYNKGLVEPTHAGYYHYFRSEWNGGVVNDDWFDEVNYIALRELSLGYTLPNSLTEKINIRNLNFSIVGRNLGYIYNSLPNNLNPEGARGNRSDYSWLERSITPYTATYSFNIKFNL
jgi:iron complex outermembrane receptor protein